MLCEQRLEEVQGPRAVGVLGAGPSEDLRVPAMGEDELYRIAYGVSQRTQEMMRTKGTSQTQDVVDSDFDLEKGTEHSGDGE